MAPPKVPDGCPLTPVQFRTLQLLCHGLTVEQAARERGVVARTIRNAANDGYRALGVHTLAQAIADMGRRGWWDWTPPPPEQRDFLKGEPLLQAHRADFEIWLESRFSDQDARDRMHHAIQGALVGKPRRRGSPHRDPLRDLLQHLAADTLNPTPPRGGRHG